MPLKQKRANRFLRASEVGLAMFVATTLVTETTTPEDVSFWVRWLVIAGISACAISLVVMFAYRNTDEYTRSLWNAGTSVSFIGTALLLLFGGFLEQLFYSMFIPERMLDPGMALALQYAQGVLILLFLAGVLGKRALASAA